MKWWEACCLCFLAAGGGGDDEVWRLGSVEDRVRSLV